jgi:flagellar basal-body rod protein FlgB
MEKLFDKTMGMLTSMLDYQSRRHKVIASNIANIDTPGYRPKELAFTKELSEAMLRNSDVEMTRSNDKHLPTGSYHINSSDFEVVEAGNKVDLDGEMGKLADNHLKYNLTVELLARKFKGLNSVLREAK